MNPIFDRLIRGTRLASLAAAVAVLSSACGVPRVHEVYRLSAIESTVSSEARLSEAQRDLRRMTLQARQIQPRMASYSTALAMLAPGELHECTPDHLARFTAASALALPDERRPAYVPVTLASRGGL